MSLNLLLLLIIFEERGNLKLEQEVTAMMFPPKRKHKNNCDNGRNKLSPLKTRVRMRTPSCSIAYSMTMFVSISHPWRIRTTLHMKTLEILSGILPFWVTVSEVSNCKIQVLFLIKKKN